MKCKKELCLSAVFFLMAFLCAAAWLHTGSAAGESLAARISPKILRFHVLANSNSAADQQLKLEVKNLLLNEMAGWAEDDFYSDTGGMHGRIGNGADENASKADDGGPAENALAADDGGPAENALAADDGGPAAREMICRCVDEHKSELEKIASDYIASRGFDYSASVCVTRSYFPTKSYGDIVLPCGTYDTVQVTLGRGRGRNWWCMLYPRLCFTDSVHAVVPEESKEELLGLVGEDDYAALLARRGTEIKIHSRLLEWITSWLPGSTA